MRDCSPISYSHVMDLAELRGTTKEASRPVPHPAALLSRPVPSRRIFKLQSRPVPRPAAFCPVPSRPVPSRPVPSRPVPSRMINFPKKEKIAKICLHDFLSQKTSCVMAAPRNGGVELSRWKLFETDPKPLESDQKNLKIFNRTFFSLFFALITKSRTSSRDIVQLFVRLNGDKPKN